MARQVKIVKKDWATYTRLMGRAARDIFRDNLESLLSHTKQIVVSQRAIECGHNLTQQRISQLKTGKDAPSFEMLDALAAGLEIPVHLLLEDKEKRGFRRIPTLADVIKNEKKREVHELLAKVLERNPERARTIRETLEAFAKEGGGAAHKRRRGSRARP